jgi:hypothetical protein
MFRQDKISIAITFVIGLIAGSYLYLTGFATTFELPEVDDSEIYAGLVITGDFYGVCDVDDACISFQLLENGGYRVIVGNRENDLIKEGVLPRGIRLELEKSLDKESLAEFSKSLTVSSCNFDIETENNYSFTISLDETEYTLDTCETAIDYESSAWASLVKLLNYFINLE